MQNVKGLKDQLGWYKNWKNEVVSLVGPKKGDYIIKNALYVISTGANDWINNYYLNPILQKEYDKETYTTFLIGKARAFLQVTAQLAMNLKILNQATYHN